MSLGSYGGYGLFDVLLEKLDSQLCDTSEWYDELDQALWRDVGGFDMGRTLRREILDQTTKRRQ